MNFGCGENNSRLERRLEQAVAEGRVSHAYLFEGPGNADKLAFAKGFIKGVFCPKGLGENCGDCAICEKVDHDNHEDVEYIFRDGLSVKDAAVEKIQEKLNVKPLGDRNVVVISDCDTMTARAQNRLLKTLEEPPGQALLILLSENQENLAQTILSRCVKFRLEGDDASIGDAKADAIIKASMNGAYFHELCAIASDYIKGKADTDVLLDSMEQGYRALMTDKKEGVPNYSFDDLYANIHAIEDARKQMRQGMSSGNALKCLLLKISK
ncbi:MAG: hypothetical protein MJ161_03085 [Clostridia bacterium]|nr:hypothetical protein [Clostridia bacterium]